MKMTSNENDMFCLFTLIYFLSGLPRPYPSLPCPGVVALAAAIDHTCAVLSDGGVDCWGANSNGQLGTGDTTDRHTPTGVTGLSAGAEVFRYMC